VKLDKPRNFDKDVKAKQISSAKQKLSAGYSIAFLFVSKRTEQRSLAAQIILMPQVLDNQAIPLH
jgi:hypothetical protein